jgi:HK97 gp10 family phage protein
VASVDVDLTELYSLSSDLIKGSQRAEDMAMMATTKALFDILRDAITAVPVDTGFLRSSVGVDIDGDSLGGEVGPTAEYGAFVELGTTRMAPQPYLGPAFEARALEWIEAMAQVGVKALAW